MKFRVSVLFRLTGLLGAAHRRQRKAMMPAFGQATSNELLPRFIAVVDKASRPRQVDSISTKQDDDSLRQRGKTYLQNPPMDRWKSMFPDGSVELPSMC